MYFLPTIHAYLLVRISRSPRAFPVGLQKKCAFVLRLRPETGGRWLEHLPEDGHCPHRQVPRLRRHDSAFPHGSVVGLGGSPLSPPRRSTFRPILRNEVASLSAMARCPAPAAADLCVDPDVGRARQGWPAWAAWRERAALWAARRSEQRACSGLQDGMQLRHQAILRACRKQGFHHKEALYLSSHACTCHKVSFFTATFLLPFSS
jgi:hypothetical protein